MKKQFKLVWIDKIDGSTDEFFYRAYNATEAIKRLILMLTEPYQNPYEFYEYKKQTGWKKIPYTRRSFK